MARFQDWVSFTQAEGRAFVEGNALGSPGQPGWFQFALQRVSDHAFVGDCGLRILESDHRLAQVGYTIGRSYWGQGYATELVRALVDYAFKAFSIHRIFASVDPRNIASVRVLEKAGLVKEAHFREAYWFKGAWADDAIYAVLAPSGDGDRENRTIGRME